MEFYEHLKKILLSHVIIMICLLIDLINPNINNCFPHEFEFLSFVVLLGISAGVSILLIQYKKHFKNNKKEN